MPPFIPIVGGVLLLAWLFSSKGKASAKSVSVETSLPADPLKKPILVSSPPSPGVPPDVQKEVDKLLNKKKTSASPSPAKPKPKTSGHTQIPINRPREEARTDTKALENIPGATATVAVIKKAADGVVSTYKVETTPEGAKVEKVKDQVVPMEGQPPIQLLRHELVPRPASKAPKLAKVTNAKLASDYAKQAFHAIVDFVEKEPSKPAEVAAFAAEQYFNAVNLAANPATYSKAMDAIRKGNALSDKAVKERKSA